MQGDVLSSMIPPAPYCNRHRVCFAILLSLETSRDRGTPFRRHEHTSVPHLPTPQFVQRFHDPSLAQLELLDLGLDIVKRRELQHIVMVASGRYEIRTDVVPMKEHRECANQVVRLA